MLAHRKCGLTINKVRNINANVIKYCDEEGEQKYLILSSENPLQGLQNTATYRHEQ
jgi:hypothetical protein